MKGSDGLGILAKEKIEKYSYKDFNNIIENKEVSTVFQPIISLKNGEILGYEALSRGPINSLMEDPKVLIDIAKEYNKLWEIENVFRNKALESIYGKVIDIKIFLNINPTIIESIKFKNSFTKEFLKKYKLRCESIIFEITEKERIKSRESFRKSIEGCREEGYKIAIDDFGAGHGGFSRICDLKPEYLKLDMDLIRDVDKDIEKQFIIKSICTYSNLSGCKLIAEGIETEEELRELIKIGVEYGQGYFIQKPSKDITLINRNIIKIIKESYK